MYAVPSTPGARTRTGGFGAHGACKEAEMEAVPKGMVIFAVHGSYSDPV